MTVLSLSIFEPNSLLHVDIDGVFILGRCFPLLGPKVKVVDWIRDHHRRVFTCLRGALRACSSGKETSQLASHL